MGKLDNFTIVFSTQPAVYFPGQTVQGFVNVVLNEDMKMRNIRLLYEGKAHVHWVKREGRGDNKQMNHYKNEKKYFSNHIILWGNRGSSGDDDPTLPAGSYSLPFQFVLPENIPASFEGPKAHATGYVRYFCKATIDKPWKFDHETKVAFTVATFYDLNKISEDLVPVSASDHKYHCCCCCRSGPITGSVNISGKSGFVPGERIPFQGEISNLSRINIKSWTVQLVQCAAYTGRRTGIHGGCKRTYEETAIIMAHTDEEDIQPGEEKNIACLLEVPPVPSSELKFCKFIDLSYAVNLIIKPAGSLNLEVSVPITIGNIPLRTDWSAVVAPIPAPGAMMPLMEPLQVPSVLPPPMPGNISQFPPGSIPTSSMEMVPQADMNGLVQSTDLGSDYASATIPPSEPKLAPSAPVVLAPYPDMPPPSYDEAFYIDANLKDDDDNSHIRTDAYKPLYPTYKWNA